MRWWVETKPSFIDIELCVAQQSATCRNFESRKPQKSRPLVASCPFHNYAFFPSAHPCIRPHRSIPLLPIFPAFISCFVREGLPRCSPSRYVIRPETFERRRQPCSVHVFVNDIFPCSHEYPSVGLFCAPPFAARRCFLRLCSCSSLSRSLSVSIYRRLGPSCSVLTKSDHPQIQQERHKLFHQFPLLALPLSAGRVDTPPIEPFLSLDARNGFHDGETTI